MNLLSLVIVFSSDVEMRNRLNRFISYFYQNVLSVESCFEDGLDTFVRIAFDVEGKSTGGFQSFRGVGFTKSQDTETRSESMVGMDFTFEQMGDELFGMRTIFGSPSDHPRRRPFEEGMVGFGEMFVKGGELSFLVTSGMGGDTPIFEENFDGT